LEWNEVQVANQELFDMPPRADSWSSIEPAQPLPPLHIGFGLSRMNGDFAVTDYDSPHVKNTLTATSASQLRAIPGSSLLTAGVHYTRQFWDQETHIVSHGNFSGPEGDREKQSEQCWGFWWRQ
jgi:hypothetical protein